jgi:hypothetical protein
MEEKLEGAGKSNVERFRKSAAARELEEENTTWVFHSWSRLAEPPVRIILMNERGDEVTWTLDAEGFWTLRKKDRG